MKEKAGLIVPVLMMLFGVYALFTTLSSGGEQVALISGHDIPRGLGMVFGLLGLGGGALIMFQSLSGRKRTL